VYILVCYIKVTLHIAGAAAHKPVPNCGNITIAAASQLKLAAVLFSELAEKPVRINEVMYNSKSIKTSVMQGLFGASLS
jgi:hypothetical protein